MHGPVIKATGSEAHVEEEMGVLVKRGGVGGGEGERERWGM